LPEGNYSVRVGYRTVASIQGGSAEQAIMLPVSDAASAQVSITRLINTVDVTLL